MLGRIQFPKNEPVEQVSRPANVSSGVIQLDVAVSTKLASAIPESSPAHTDTGSMPTAAPEQPKALGQFPWPQAPEELGSCVLLQIHSADPAVDMRAKLPSETEAPEPPLLIQSPGQPLWTQAQGLP